MPLSQQPFSLRYLKARLRVLKRPQVWGTTAGLVLTIALANYWLHPSRARLDRSDLPASAPASGNAPTTAADSSSAATPTPLPILPTPLSSPDRGNARRQNLGSSPTNAFDRNNSSPLGFQAPQASPNPLSPDASLPLQQGLIEGDRGSTASTNPPRTAIDRTSPYSAQPAPGSTSAVPTNIQPEGVTLPARISPPATNLQPGAMSPYRAQTSPPPGTTGYTLPPSLVSPASAPPAVNSLPQPVPGLPASPTNSVYGMPNAVANPAQPQIQVPPPVPPPVVMPQPPGRPIGNGQVNTFANP